jgi:hypothetical protein
MGAGDELVNGAYRLVRCSVYSLYQYKVQILTPEELLNGACRLVRHSVYSLY